MSSCLAPMLNAKQEIAIAGRRGTLNILCPPNTLAPASRFPPPAMADPKIPDIGKYHIIELLGEGAMGVVYKATDSVLDRVVAIKVMNESIARQEDLRKRFLREAQAAASLQHPNVVCIYDLGDMAGHLYIAMEFIEGVDLEKLIEISEPLSLQAKLDIVIDVLTGLSFAHKRGIVHRDIKPANIRVTEEGRAKIMDFGVAHLASSSMTRTGSFLGTPSFMAPEQITEGKTSPATDIFAVGGVLFQLLTLMKPFDGPTLQNLFFKIITEKPKRVSELMPGLPVALDGIVEKALAKDPEDRYTSALDMANDLTSVRAKLSGPAYPESVSLSASVSSAIEQSRKHSRTRTRNFTYAGAGALAAIVVAVGWSQLVKSRPTPRPADTTTVAVVPRSSQGSIAANTVPAAANTEVPAIPQPTLARQARKQTSIGSGRGAQMGTPTRIDTRPIQSQTVVSLPPSKPIPPPTATQEIVTQQPAVAVPRPAPTPPQETAPAVVPSPVAADIAPAVESYARAIESRDIAAIRRVYPGLTADQQHGFEQFFQSARNINVTFRVANVEGSGSSADARLVGTYEYTNSEGRAERQPVNFAASLRREGSSWRLVSVR
jgi:eukaryotic-like serine/threonine-protein kinase